MGSHLTQLPDRMQWLMGELHNQDYYYLDSKTSNSNSSFAAAQKARVPYLSRDIFLDHNPSPAAIEAAFEQAVQLAVARGHAVVLAHPYPSTMAFLEKNLPELASRGVSLATPSELLAQWRDKTRLTAKLLCNEPGCVEPVPENRLWHPH